MIELTDVHKSFQQGHTKIPILKGLNLSMASKTSLAVVGPSGSGKSTLLAILSGLEQADSGQSQVMGYPLHSLDSKGLADFRKSQVSIVYQDFQLFSHLTALENIIVALQVKGFNATEAKKKALHWLDLVKLSDRAQHQPAALSGGEQQRVALARALSVEPQLLLADEPSGNLDQATGKVVMDILFDRVKQLGSTMILVTHDLQLAKQCDALLSLQNGRLKSVDA